MSLLKKFARYFFQDRGRERPEYFTMLDAPVQNFFHFRTARIGEYAALPQRARAPFRAALKLFDGAANVLRRGLRSPSGVVHNELTRAPENLMIHRERRADRKPGVARSRLNVNTFERRVIKDFSVGHAVEGHAACKAQRFFPGLSR